MPHPILYTFRRCPYAIRARMALAYAKLPFEVREVFLKNKPASMLEASPKGTVPILICEDGAVIDQSMDIIRWALSHHDPDHWLSPSPEEQSLTDDLIRENDSSFKASLDLYKYNDRHPEHAPAVHRQEAEVFLKKLEALLKTHPFLLGESLRLADIALFPFVRQFANVDREWFSASPYEGLRTWLRQHQEGALFNAVMEKYTPWQEGDVPLLFGAP